MSPKAGSLVLMVLCCLPCSQASGGEFYHLIMFGSQREKPQPKYSHTFATFVKASGQGPSLDSYRLERTPLAGFLPPSMFVHSPASRNVAEMCPSTKPSVGPYLPISGFPCGSVPN